MKIVFTIHPVQWKGKETTVVACEQVTYFKNDEGFMCCDNEDSRYALNKVFIPRENISSIQY